MQAAEGLCKRARGLKTLKGLTPYEFISMNGQKNRNESHLIQFTG
jgi:hypothetical protein